MFDYFKPPTRICGFCKKSTIKMSSLVTTCIGCNIEYLFNKNGQIICISYMKDKFYELNFYPLEGEIDIYHKNKDSIIKNIFQTQNILSLNDFEYYLNRFLKLKIFS